MNLLDLLDSVGGQQSLGSLASSLGLDASKTNNLVAALAPALMGALKKETSSQAGLDGFKKCSARRQASGVSQQSEQHDFATNSPGWK